MSKKSNSSGFTLIELLLVIAIIGVLSSIVLTSVSVARAKSRDTQRISDIRQMRIALQLFAVDNGGRYPTDINNLVPTYLPVLPTDPLGGPLTPCRVGGTGTYKYSYSLPSASSLSASYHMCAQLEQSNTILSSKANCNSLTGSPPCPMPGGATGYSGGFNGTGALVYDVSIP